MFNVGYMWIDFIMLLTGTSGNTEENFRYYQAFYLSDFIFRFVFKEGSTDNCWFPWASCLNTIDDAEVEDFEKALKLTSSS